MPIALIRLRNSVVWSGASFSHVVAAGLQDDDALPFIERAMSTFEKFRAPIKPRSRLAKALTDYIFGQVVTASCRNVRIGSRSQPPRCAQPSHPMR